MQYALTRAITHHPATSWPSVVSPCTLAVLQYRVPRPASKTLPRPPSQPHLFVHVGEPDEPDVGDDEGAQVALVGGEVPHPVHAAHDLLLGQQTQLFVGDHRTPKLQLTAGDNETTIYFYFGYMRLYYRE